MMSIEVNLTSKMIKIDNFAHFQSFLTSNWCQLTWVCVLSKWIFIWDTNIHTTNIYANHHKIHLKVVLWPFTQQKFTILRIFDHFLRWIDVNWHHYVCYLSKYSSETLTDCKYWCKSSYNPLKSDFVAIYSTKNYDFAHFRSFLTQRWRQIDINWRQYVCYLSKYSSNTLTDCIYWCKPS